MMLYNKNALSRAILFGRLIYKKRGKRWQGFLFILYPPQSLNKLFPFSAFPFILFL